LSAEIKRFAPGGHRPIPRRLAYPSEYGLANAASQLIRDYGKDGAINKLIEMAGRIERDEDPLRDIISKARRVEPPFDANRRFKSGSF
jgi:hypothetical protein